MWNFVSVYIIESTQTSLKHRPVFVQATDVHHSPSLCYLLSFQWLDQRCGWDAGHELQRVSVQWVQGGDSCVICWGGWRRGWRVQWKWWGRLIFLLVGPTPPQVQIQENMFREEKLFFNVGFSVSFWPPPKKILVSYWIRCAPLISKQGLFSVGSFKTGFGVYWFQCADAGPLFTF